MSRHGIASTEQIPRFAEEWQLLSWVQVDVAKWNTAPMTTWDKTHAHDATARDSTDRMDVRHRETQAAQVDASQKAGLDVMRSSTMSHRHQDPISARKRSSSRYPRCRSPASRDSTHTRRCPPSWESRMFAGLLNLRTVRRIRWVLSLWAFTRSMTGSQALIHHLVAPSTTPGTIHGH